MNSTQSQSRTIATIALMTTLALIFSYVEAILPLNFGIPGVSVAGGTMHNLGQLLTAAAIVENLTMFVYFPVLLFSGNVTGILIGIAAYAILRKLPQTFHTF